MDPITEGMSGAAVEDIQDRLVALGYPIDDTEKSERHFGQSTVNSVARFRLDHGLSLGQDVDTATWSTLVDEGYKMGDRTLYLRLPNFHGADVRKLQDCLNILGFSAGKTDGYFGPHTEAAVKQFQESIGALPDGMAFPDTFDAIERLHHVWAGKQANGPHPQGATGFARAANVLEGINVSITAEDPISRNVAGRVWNLATATNEKSTLDIADTPQDARPTDRAMIVVASTPQDAQDEEGSTPNVILEDADTLPRRIRTAYESSQDSCPLIRVELPLGSSNYNGTFTTGDAQTFAVMLLDAICSAFA